MYAFEIPKSMFSASNVRSKRTVSEHIDRLCTKHLILSKRYICIWIISISSFALAFALFLPQLHKNDKQCKFAFNCRRRVNYKTRKMNKLLKERLRDQGGKCHQCRINLWLHAKLNCRNLPTVS